MIYAKRETSDGKTVKTAICQDNIYAHCPDCGCEHNNVNIPAMLKQGGVDLSSTEFLCRECGQTELRAMGIDSTTPKATLDGLKLLDNALRKADYSEILGKLYDEYEIEKLDELEPCQYQSFTCALTRIAETGDFYSDDSDDQFAFVPKEARGCMTTAELESALHEMSLLPAMEKVVREVCHKGFVIASELKEKGGKRNVK